MAAVACTADSAHEPSVTSNVVGSVTMIGAGDTHAKCTDSHPSKATAAIVEAQPAALVYVMGDNAGIHGTAAEYDCYDISWGMFKSRTIPAIGNHERNIDSLADAYYDYFNGEGVDSGAAGHRARGYYALTYGGWRIFVANSQQHQSDQAAWIARDLAANPTLCAMAIMHRPLFTSSAKVRPYPRVEPIWRSLYEGGADVILAGHAHQYERFAKTTWDGTRNRSRGIRHFVAGMGGGIIMRFDSVPHPASEVRIATHGVLKLRLWPDHYAWKFIAVTGRVLDSGQDVCHR
jgi:hypothetical protein